MLKALLHPFLIRSKIPVDYWFDYLLTRLLPYLLLRVGSRWGNFPISSQDLNRYEKLCSSRRRPVSSDDSPVLAALNRAVFFKRDPNFSASFSRFRFFFFLVVSVASVVSFHI